MSPICEEAAVLGLLTSADLNWILFNLINLISCVSTLQPPPFFSFFKMFVSSLTALVFVQTFTTLRDPLEQFDVLALPVVGGGLTNLSLLLALNVLVMSI
jgi:hypothetical protein